MTLAHLTVTGGRTTGSDEDGGGIRADCLYDADARPLDGQRQPHDGCGRRGRRNLRLYVTLTDSTVSGNRTQGECADGGGIYGNYVFLTDSTVSGNRTEGRPRWGRRDLRPRPCS